MRSYFAMLSMLLGLLVLTACGGDKGLPAMPEPIETTDETSGGDLDSLMDEDSAETE
ncbi:MAG: hypothetical protein H5U40_03385 [Polyangiaceae bacterium]|nr:hypothetical protein [Polyangiaceae bacterium]